MTTIKNELDEMGVVYKEYSAISNYISEDLIVELGRNLHTCVPRERSVKERLYKQLFKDSQCFRIKKKKIIEEELTKMGIQISDIPEKFYTTIRFDWCEYEKDGSAKVNFKIKIRNNYRTYKEKEFFLDLAYKISPEYKLANLFVPKEEVEEKEEYITVIEEKLKEEIRLFLEKTNLWKEIQQKLPAIILNECKEIKNKQRKYRKKIKIGYI